MANIYLVGGLTPRTDLDNYQTAFLSKEKAEESKAYWNSFHEDNDYDEYHIDSIEIEDLAEHDSELLDKAAEKFIAWDSKIKGIREDGVCFFTIENVLKGIEELKAEVERSRE